MLVLAFVAAMGFNADVNAQGLLKGLKNKLKEKVESTVGSKLGLPLGKKSGNTATPAATTATPAATASYESSESSGDGIKELAASGWSNGEYFDLFKANSTGEYDSNGDLILRKKQSTLHFNSVNDMLAALPAIPTAKQILNPEGEGAAAIDGLINFDLARNDFNARREQAAMEDAMKRASAAMANMGNPAAGGMPIPQPQNEAMQQLSTSLMGAMLNSGLDLENASEEEIMKATLGTLSKELNIPEAEMAKMMEMAKSNPEAATAYMMKKYPNVTKKFAPANPQPQAASEENELDQYQDIFDEIEALQKDEAFIAASKRVPQMPKIMQEYANQLLSQWATSETCAKIEAMEKELDQKTDAYMKEHNLSYNDEAPKLWTDGRKEQNALIDAYNETMVEQWRAKVQEEINYFKPHAERLAKLEARLNEAAKTLTNKTSQTIMIQWQNISATLANYSFFVIYELPAVAMDAPRIYHVAEQWLP